jgi:glycosyltransferase involved in cell wall biosynthesis
LLPGWYEEFEQVNLSYWRSMQWAIRLFRQSRKFDAVVTGAEHCGMMFALLQTLFRRPSRRRPHVMIDFPWSANPNRPTLALKVLQMRIASPSLNAIFAHASADEAARFTAALRVRDGLFRFVPFHYSLEEPLPETKLGDYVFSGGNSGRDHATLLDAIANNSHPAILCTQEMAGLRNKCIPENVQVCAVTQERFHELMAASAVVVVPVIKDDIHPAGHTVVVTAMALGKPVVLAATADYHSYIEDGVTGLLVPAGDSAALRAAIDRVLSDREFASMLARNAKAESTRFAPEKFFSRVFRCVDEAVALKRKPGVTGTEGVAR